jgi:hypothetical protein
VAARSRRGGILLGAALALVAALALLSVSLASGSRLAATCTRAALAPVYVNSTGAAGSVDGEYGFKNKGTHTCSLVGYPTVQLLRPGGGTLPTSEQHVLGAYGIPLARVTLLHGGVAYFGIRYPAATGYGNLTCPSSAALRLTAPGTAGSLTLGGKAGMIQAFGGSTVHLHCGMLVVSALSAKRFQ